MAGGGAFVQALAEEYYTRLLAYANALTGASPDAPDLVQETFLTALDRAAELEKHPNPYGWLRITLFNHVRHWRTKRQRELSRRAPPEETEDGPRDPLEHVPEPKDPLSDRLLSIDLSRLLTEEEYRLLRMVYFEGASAEEAARVLGIAPAACRKRVQRLRDRLRGKLRE